MGIRIPILAYHAIDKRPSAISTHPATFKWQMRWLHRHGYEVVPLSNIVGALQGHEPLPRRSVAITFDDGFESVYANAFPVLRRYGFPATVFLVSDYCGRESDWPSQPPAAPRLPLMSWTQAREMAEHRIDFGAHTASHPRLDHLEIEDVDREIMSSKQCIEDRLERPVQHFAYPYGRRNELVEMSVGREFSGACTTRLGMVGSGSGPLNLERVDAYYFQHPILFQALPTRLFDLYLSVRRPARAAASLAFRRAWN